MVYKRSMEKEQSLDSCKVEIIHNLLFLIE